MNEDRLLEFFTSLAELNPHLFGQLNIGIALNLDGLHEKFPELSKDQLTVASLIATITEILTQKRLAFDMEGVKTAGAIWYHPQGKEK